MSADHRREVQRIVERLAQQGWAVSISGHSHWRLCPQDKQYAVQFVSFTPSDYRAIKNIRSQLRKAGAQLD